MKEDSTKVSLKLNIQKTKIMASGPITSSQVDGEIVETVADFIFLGSKITADGECSREIQRCLLFGRKENKEEEKRIPRRHIKKLRLYFANKGPPSQNIHDFSCMYGCASWTIE